MAEAKPNNSSLGVQVNGKIMTIEQFDGANGPIYSTVITIPSPDSYDPPTRITVKSHSQIGREGDIVDVKATVSSRYYKATEGKRKGKVQYNPELWLDAA